jgi:hypothetical protein
MENIGAYALVVVLFAVLIGIPIILLVGCVWVWGKMPPWLTHCSKEHGMASIPVSLALAYLLCGFHQVNKALTCTSLLDRPLWVYTPTLGNAILYGIQWFIRPFDPFYLKCRQGIQVAFGLVLGLILKMGVVTGFIWYCIAVSAHFFDSTILQIVTTALLVFVGARFVLPLADLLMVALTALFTTSLELLFWPLEFLFCSRERPTSRESSGVETVDAMETPKKKCPHCAEKIAADAVECRYCGESLRSQMNPAQEGKPMLERKIILKKHQVTAIVVAVILLVVSFLPVLLVDHRYPLRRPDALFKIFICPTIGVAIAAIIVFISFLKADKGD